MTSMRESRVAPGKQRVRCVHAVEPHNTTLNEAEIIKSAKTGQASIPGLYGPGPTTTHFTLLACLGCPARWNGSRCEPSRRAERRAGFVCHGPGSDWGRPLCAGGVVAARPLPPPPPPGCPARWNGSRCEPSRRAERRAGFVCHGPGSDWGRPLCAGGVVAARPLPPPNRHAIAVSGCACPTILRAGLDCIAARDVISLTQTVKAFPSHVPRRPIVRLPLIPLLIVLAGLGLPSRTLADQITLIDITNTVWRFNDHGDNLGTAWRAVNYPAEANPPWANGIGLFGVDTTVRVPPLYPAPFQTPLVLGAGRITYYFRTRFIIAQDPASNIVHVTAYIDDGAVFYVNGIEVNRIRLPTDPVLYNTTAQLANPEGVPFDFDIDPTNLVLGTNTIAVEVHQQNESSSDVVFGLQMVSTGTLAPTILDPTQPADRTVNQGQPTTFFVVGSGIPAPDYRWYFSNSNVSNLLIPGANGSTYTIAAVGPEHAGNYYAVLSNSLGTATSRVAVLTVILDTTAPYV